MSETSPAPEWLPAWFNADQIDTVIVAFPDVYGRLMGKRLTHSYFSRTTAAAGTHACNYLLTVDVEMNPMPGFKLASWEQGYGDFHLQPALRTMKRVPWQEATSIVLADVLHHDHSPVIESPRAVLQRQLERLNARGMMAHMASELEFYLFRNSYSEAHSRAFRELTPSSDYLIDYHLLGPARDEDVMRRLRNEMNEAGIIIEGSKGEWGRGQHELNMLYAEALEMADRHAIFKHGAKEIAAQQSSAITFMAKWDQQQAGSSFHLHTSIWDQDASQNLFADAESGEATDLFRQFLGGVLKYGRELTYFFAPTVNSYKRYQAESWAPTTMVWAHDNRTTGYRVVGHGDSLRFENRTPGADANPYLAYAATIAAGLRGIDEKLDCGDPYQGNAYVDEQLPRLPASLDEAAGLLEKSELAREAMGNDVVDFYVHTAQLEAAEYSAAVTDWERARYFERL